MPNTPIPFKVVIPARYQSSRLPGKVLIELAGKPMLEHVYHRAKESGAEQIVIAVDDQKVAQVARSFGAEVCMTRVDHRTGTDRLAEVALNYDWSDNEIIVNLQGDEPLMPAQLMQCVAENLNDNKGAAISTLAVSIKSITELFDPNVVKVIVNKKSEAMYFSRAVIPWHRDQFHHQPHQLPDTSNHYRHLGMYAYRAGFLKEYSKLEACDYEQQEALEQLRVLWHGFTIHVGITDTMPGHGVDTLGDVSLVEKLLQKQISL